MDLTPFEDQIAREAAQFYVHLVETGMEPDDALVESQKLIEAKREALRHRVAVQEAKESVVDAARHYAADCHDAARDDSDAARCALRQAGLHECEEAHTDLLEAVDDLERIAGT